MSATLRAAVSLLAVEAAALYVVVGWLIYEDLTGTPETRRGALAVILYAAMMATFLAGLAFALWRRQRWARGPAMVLQLLMLPMGYTMVSAGAIWLGAPVMLAGLGGALSLAAPSTRAALGVR